MPLSRRGETSEDSCGPGLGQLTGEDDHLIDALRRICDGECVIDPTIVARLMQRQRPDSPLTTLTPREREILALMAEGRSNAGVASELNISERTVEAASAQMFRKLGLQPSPDLNRRVLAVLALLRQ